MVLLDVGERTALLVDQEIVVRLLDERQTALVDLREDVLLERHRGVELVDAELVDQVGAERVDERARVGLSAGVEVGHEQRNVVALEALGVADQRLGLVVWHVSVGEPISPENESESTRDGYDMPCHAVRTCD